MELEVLLRCTQSTKLLSSMRLGMPIASDRLFREVVSVTAAEVKVPTAAQHAELMQVLDDRLVATKDVPGSDTCAFEA